MLEGHLSLRKANDRMEVSYRHAQYLKGVVARNGPRKLTHGNTETCPGNAVDGLSGTRSWPYLAPSMLS